MRKTHCQSAYVAMLTAAAALLALLLAPPPAAAQPATAGELERQLVVLIKAEEWEAAIQLCDAALQRSRNARPIVEIAAGVYIHRVRDLIALERFAAAQELLERLKTFDPANARAEALLDSILKARDLLPHRLQQAKALIEVEQFELAATILWQADGLDPANADARAAMLIEAAAGDADDHFAAANYAEAFIQYDRTLQRFGHSLFLQRRALRDRWTASMLIAAAAGRIAIPERAQLGYLQAAATAIANSAHPQLTQLAQALGWTDPADLQLGQKALFQSIAAQPDRDQNLAAATALARTLNPTILERRGEPWLFALPGPPRTMPADPNTTIHHHNAYAAQRLAQAIQSELTRIPAALGLDPQAARPTVPLEVHLHPPGQALPLKEPLGSGFCKKIIRNGALAGLGIHLLQEDPALFSATLPHELAHALIATAIGPTSLPLAIEEGWVLQAESSHRRLRFYRLIELERRTQPAAQVLDLPGLLAATDYGPTPALFYARSAALVHYAVAELGADRFAQFAARTGLADWPVELPKALGKADLGALQVHLDAWVRNAAK